MKNLFLFCLATLLCGAATAQRVYFIYVQTDDQAPFYVRMADKIHSSSASGYLILPNLIDSTYNLNVGFVKSTLPETRFNVTLGQGDKGYLIKNFQDGLALFDMQDLSLVKAATTNVDNTVYETKSDKFSSILSKAADDPGLLKVPVAKKEEPKVKQEEKEVVVAKNDEKKVEEKPKDTVVVKPVEAVETKPEKKEETTVKADTATTQNITKPDDEIRQPAVKDETSVTNTVVMDYKPSVIRRHAESSTTEGFGIIYFDKSDNGTDTIRILIPVSKLKIEEEVQVQNSEDMKKTEDIAVTTPEQKKSEATVETKKDKQETVVVTPAGCPNIASEKDFMKLRKNMAAKSNEDDMIAEAKKAFKGKCYTTEQVRYLSTLFLTSASKYQFFDAAFSYVLDKSSFASLQSEIKDEYYLKRFKALVGE